MARIIGGIGASHSPTIGFAKDTNKHNDPAWKPIFDGFDVVRKWARNAAKHPHTYAWYLGYGGIPLCEYYLRTGDKEVLPGIRKWVDNAVKGQYLDGWAGRGGVCSVTYGNGHLNAGGTAVVTLLLLAKECDVDVPEHALLGALGVAQEDLAPEQIGYVRVGAELWRAQLCQGESVAKGAAVRVTEVRDLTLQVEPA